MFVDYMLEQGIKIKHLLTILAKLGETFKNATNLSVLNVGKLLYASPIRTYTHLKVENILLPVSKGQGRKLKSKHSFKRARPETKKKTLI